MIVKSNSLLGMPFRSQSFQTVITSIPYWFQRQYDPNGGSLGFEWGLEPFHIYIERARWLAKNLHEVLKDDGLWWLNIGDTASGSGGAGGDHYNPKGSKRHIEKYSQPDGWSGMAKKQYMNVPARVAIAIQDMLDMNGEPMWLMRKEIIWNKERLERCDGNHVRRPKGQTERIFMFSKGSISSVKDYKFYFDRLEDKGDIWAFPPNTTGDKGPAPFPDELARRCIEVSTDPGDRVYDPCSGSGTTARVANMMGRIGVGSELYI